MAKWFLRDEEDTEHADRLLDRYLDEVAALTAPCFLRYELSNALLRAVRDGRIPREAAVRSIQRLAGLGIAQQGDSDERVVSAFALAFGLGISFYDAMYVALGQELNLPVITADIVLRDRVVTYLPGAVRLFQEAAQ